MTTLPKVMHESWHKHLQHLFEDSKMTMIKDEILSNCSYYPSIQEIFRVFSMPIDSINVVVLGQDPFPNGEANGLAFATNENNKLPASLRVIAKEVFKDSGELVLPNNQWQTLTHWHEQGVFLLNTALTVEQKNAGSHLGVWQWFTREVIKIISKENPCIWMLWGAKAQSFKYYMYDSILTLNGQPFKDYVLEIGEYVKNQNIILEAPHPAAELYAGKTGKTFSGCNHFVTCNEILQLKNKQKINF